MAKIEYSLSPFDYIQASAGALVVIVSSGYTVPGTITNVTITNGAEVKHPNFWGAGICKVTVNGDFNLTVNSVVHTFDRNGVSKSTPSIGKKIVMGVVTNEVRTTGNAINVESSGYTTRSAGGDSTIVVAGGQSVIENLNARDNFAIKVLQGFFRSMDKDPVTLSNNEMMNYCQQAYQWAANMMTVAASSRAELNDTTATNRTRSVPVGSLDNNTDKLLNNILAELERNDAPVSEDGTWIKKGNNDVRGKYTDAVAATLTPSQGHSAYTSIADAENDGWVWEADIYAESVAFSEVTMKGLEKLARQQRGVHKSSDEDTEDAQDSVVDPDEPDANIRFYNMSLYEHNVKKWLEAFTKKLGVSETRTTLGMHELIDALQRTDSSEVVDGTTVYSERIVNPKLNKLLEDLQETISNKKYERVTVYKLDDILTTLNTLNTTLTTGFANIVTALNTFTSNMNTRFTNVESAISSAKTDVINAIPSTSGLATSSDVSSAESAIIAAMPSCRYTPPSDNNT